jgi:hypothetical protein
MSHGNGGRKHIPRLALILFILCERAMILIDYVRGARKTPAASERHPK